jgi:8-oxo-dGTP pyrophosphatase MutT (NUDIX family)/phosphohistidine phosphatase SixA
VTDPKPALHDPSVPGVVLAAGVICWRPSRERARERVRDADRDADRAGLEVLLIHRPRYDDWSWPKGKIEPGETLPECAVREAAEETGAHVVLGVPLSHVEYPLPDGRTKRVDYWAARSLRNGSPTAPTSEVDQVRWVNTAVARERLSRPSDLAPLETLLTAAREGALGTRPVVVVRHATARPRDAWARADADRPLVASGRRQSLALAPLLRCWRPEHVLTSPWRRCLETLGPYVAATGARVRTKGGLSEDGFRRDPTKARKHTVRLLRRDSASLLCTHRPVLGAVLTVMRMAADPQVARCVPSTDPFLAPGEVLVAHVVAGVNGPQIVAVERHLPPR